MSKLLIYSKYDTKETLNPDTVAIIKEVLNHCNPFVRHFRHVGEVISQSNHQELKLILIGNRNRDGRVYNFPSSSEVAALVVGNQEMDFSIRDITLQSHWISIQRINELHAAYLPLQYSLLFSYGEDGYRDDVLHNVNT